MSQPPSTHGPQAREASVVRRWAWVAWAALVIVVSVVPAGWLLGVAPREAWSALASAAHFMEYLILAALLLWRSSAESGAASGDGGASGGPGATAIATRAALGALGIACAVELVQWPLPYRSFDPLDLLADAGGIAVAVAGFMVLLRRPESWRGR